jgi:hypothetical protein
MSATAPSCIRAPPDAVTISSGTLSRRAVSPASVISSPTAPDRLPPMNPKSMTATTSGFPSISPAAQTTASSSPVLALALASRCGYGLESTKPSGSASRTGRSRSCVRRWWASTRL